MSLRKSLVFSFPVFSYKDGDDDVNITSLEPEAWVFSFEAMKIPHPPTLLGRS